MKNLFFRLYLLLLVTIIGLGWSLDQLYDAFSEAQNPTTDVELHKGTLFLLNKELKRHAPGAQTNYLKAIAPSFGYPINLVPMQVLPNHRELQQHPLSADQIQYLEYGGVVALFDDFNGKSWFLQKLTATERVIVLGPILHDSVTQAETLYTVVFFFALAGIVFIWVWPISKGLVAMSRTATEFGKGDWSVRVTTQLSTPLLPLAERFNEMAARIQRLIKSHQELSHAVSHELRTPIARIRFAMEMVRDVNNDQAREKYLNSMENNIEELDGLVDELLSYARFDREEPNIEFNEHNIVEVVEDVLAKFRFTETALSFTTQHLNLPEPNTLICCCDAEAIARILDNLVRNATRYAKQEIEVQIALNGAQVQLSVNDDGPGIPKESWQSIFDPFVRLDKSRDRKSGGIGLGLAIVKRYIELHKGTVCIEESPAGGARFVLCWPQAHEE